MKFSFSLHPDLLADMVLVVHLCLAIFVVLGFAVIVCGWICKWSWPRHFWFRMIHIGTMVVIASLTILGQHCPLTVWESRLRCMAIGHQDSPFIRFWISRLLFYDAPLGFFLVLYVACLVTLGLLMWIYPPWFKKRS